VRGHRKRVEPSVGIIAQEDLGEPKMLFWALRLVSTAREKAGLRKGAEGGNEGARKFASFLVNQKHAG